MSFYALCRNLVVAVALFVATAASAQSLVVKGTVVDSEGNALPGASVIVPGTTNGVTTDVNGAFSISVKPNTNLEVSFIGYVPQTVEIGAQVPPPSRSRFLKILKPLAK